MESDQDYFRRRAAEERNAAAKAGDPRVRDIHLELERQYKRVAAGGWPVANCNAPLAASRADPSLRVTYLD